MSLNGQGGCLMRIGVDKGQQAGKHETKHNWLRQNGHELLELPLPVGDYIEITEAIQSIIDRRGDILKKMDFMGAVKISVDTKADLQEVVGNIMGSKKKSNGKKASTHDRFRDECILAQQIGIKLYILVEHGGKITSLEAVKDWINPRQFLYEKKIRKEWNISKDADFQTEITELKSHGAKIVRGPTTGEELYKAMVTMSEKYGVEWVFTDKKTAGQKIIELLGGSQ
jgi:ribosome-associated protein